MRRLFFATFVCLITSSAYADDRKKIDILAIQIANDGYYSLSAAYFCRNVAGIDTYLKVRKGVEAIMVKLTADADLVRQTIGSWETQLENDPRYKNPDVTKKECTDALTDSYQKLDATFNAMLDIRGDR